MSSVRGMNNYIELNFYVIYSINQAESICGSTKQGLSASNLISRYSFPVKPVDTYWGPLKESAVNALSNLLNANVEVGLRFTLAMGYHEDSKMRNSCMQILSNILNAGAQFDTLADTIVNDRYEKLVEVRENSLYYVTHVYDRYWLNQIWKLLCLFVMSVLLPMLLVLPVFC